jgi:hypothetical protein
MNSLLIRTITVAVLLLMLFTPGAAQTLSLDYDKLQAETAQRLSEYLRINSSNPPGNELATARWLKQVLEREGIEGQILDTAELGQGRANFYARLKGSRSGKAIALVHHMDVVPVERVMVGRSVCRVDQGWLCVGSWRTGHEGTWHHPADDAHRHQAIRHSTPTGSGVHRKRG